MFLCTWTRPNLSKPARLRWYSTPPVDKARDRVARTQDSQIERDGPTKGSNPVASSYDAYIRAAIITESAAAPPEAHRAAAARNARGACQAAAGPAIISGLRRPPLFRALSARTAGP